MLDAPSPGTSPRRPVGQSRHSSDPCQPEVVAEQANQRTKLEEYARRKGRLRSAPWRREAFNEAQGKGRVAMRPGTSQVRGHRDPISGSAAPQAVDQDDLASAARVAQLGVALAESARRLATARREIATLRRENAELRAVADRRSVA
jgi:hypothetical protein